MQIAGKEQVGQRLRTFHLVQIYAASDARVAQQLFTLIREKPVSLIFFCLNTFFQRALTKKQAVTKTSIRQSASITGKASLLIHGTSYVKSGMQERVLHGRLHRTAGWQNGAAGQLVAGACSASSESTDLESFHTAY